MGQINGGYAETLSGVALDNAGTTTLAGVGNYGLSLENNAVVDNQTVASFTFVDEVSIFSDGTATSFVNAGTLAKIGRRPNSTGRFDSPLARRALGATSLQSGDLVLNIEGTISGSMVGSAGTLLYFGGDSSANFDASSSITTAGSVRFDGPMATEDGTYDVSGSTLVLDPQTVLTFNSDATITSLGSDLQISSGALNLTTPQSFSLTSLEMTQGTTQRRRLWQPDGDRLDDLGRRARFRDLVRFRLGARETLFGAD